MEDMSLAQLRISSNFSRTNNESLTAASSNNELIGIRLTFVVAMIVFSVAGLFGNLMIIFTILLATDLRTTRNAFLMNLSVSDLVLISIVVPFNVISVLRGGHYWHNRTNLCMFVASICAPACLSAIWSNAGVAFNRYFYICHFGSYSKYFSPVKTCLWILAIWIISFSIHLPNHLGWGHNGYAEQFYLCTREMTMWSYSTFYSAVGIVLPLAISFYSYCRIYALVRNTTQARNKITSAQPSQAGIEVTKGQFRAELQLVKTLFRSFAVCCVAWMPLAILLVLPASVSGIPAWVYLATVFLSHGSTATNAILYFCTNDSFKKGLKTFVRKVRGRATQAAPSSVGQHGATNHQRASRPSEGGQQERGQAFTITGASKTK
ncbi:hypothetical protein RvY_08304 [Ramazzottius varieornatus]|uniref:G-protein coupled receptors family 1 profile domain-containing protein n=1 Tax=Ramazzottius varieornatus TaxID=947166 RepID=A0A1D1VB32_RAMVA|nr:hypothetical protein RvY_08304 [Ramazzottius varieornatus]